ncbi:MAG: hypothetical protein ABIR70_04405 [Bryobacteraceae bacterium]
MTALEQTRDLGMAMLIAEFDDGYAPVDIVGSLNEAREAAQADLKSRLAALATGNEPACPIMYAIWSRDDYGRLALRTEISL